MRVVALKAWSNGSISMEERQIAELPDALATSLIEQGIVEPTALPEITDADDGKVLTADSGVWVAANPSSVGGVLVVTDTDGTLDKTWQEIHDAMLVGGVVISTSSTDSLIVTRTRYNTKDSAYEVTTRADIMYLASSASGYPTLSE